MPKILDNKMQGTVFEELQQRIRAGSKISAVSAYFTIYAYAALKRELNNIGGMRLLFTEPTFVKDMNAVSREFCIDHEKAISGNIYEIKLRNEMKQSAVAKECAEWVRKKVSVRSFKNPNIAQPRLVYIDDADNKTAINGTVDLTMDGLGLIPSERQDMNICTYDGETESFLMMFEHMWNDPQLCEDVKEEMLQHMEVLYQENTPEFIYHVMLYNIFSSYLDELTEDNIIRSGINFKESAIWNKLYKFQKDAVLGIIDKMEKYSGCILADSVGLGKTFTALAVMKYYQSRNDRILVLCPKKLRDNWSVYTMNDMRNIFINDRFNYDILNHTDLSRESGASGDINLATINWSNYDMVVIDESHNFRNDPPFKDHITRYQRLMNDIIKKGVKTKVLMLSATPVNNTMADIRNQISFITEGNTHALEYAGISDIDSTIAKAQRTFSTWSQLPDETRTTERFVEMMHPDYFKLLDTMTIARSRKHIEKYYSVDEIGKFPERLPPVNKYSRIDSLDKFPTIKEINTKICRLNLSVYCPMEYLLPNKREHYAEMYDIQPKDGRSILKQTDREKNLVNLMRVNILKRLESSVYAFGMTSDKILEKVEDALRRIDTAESTVAEMDFEDLGFEDPDMDPMSFGKRIQVELKDMDLIRWRQDLERDREKLIELRNEAKNVTPDRDQKLRDLMTTVSEKISNPINDGNRKVIIFTAFADTANYLYDCLSANLKAKNLNSAIVTGTGNNQSTVDIPHGWKNKIKMSDINTVLTLFSPNSKEKKMIFPDFEGEIDILFCTDCISEGQNLQDCDCLINYDIHWNPVRIIQRFGRIDRIGSKNNKVQLVNFWPTKDLDEYIDLQQRVKGRMVLVDISSTGEENIIDPRGEMRDLEYRKKQLERLQSEVVDLEDIKGGISITDMTFSDFKTDLMHYLKDNRELLEKTPLGLHAVVRNDTDDISKGILFVLKQIEGKTQTKEQNPMFPYYIAYISEDGSVKVSFVHTKKLLDTCRKLCVGKNIIQKDIAEQFNEETDDGRKMKKYSDLLERMISDIIGKKNEAGVSSLFSRGGTSTQTDLSGGVEDFEIVAFLVIG